jgi:hypothetical protein
MAAVTALRGFKSKTLKSFVMKEEPQDLITTSTNNFLQHNSYTVT